LPEPVCGYSFVQIIAGTVPDGAVAIYGYLVKRQDGLYLFMSKESVAGNIYQESVLVSEAPTDYKERPFTCKFVQVIGYFSNSQHHVHDQFFSTAGQIKAASIRFSGALSVEC
jgi:hypothetical protein